ncbi:hypothetical protein Tcan_01278, partial [Toxocara canis]
WKIWTHEYMVSLQERHRTEHQQPYRVTGRAPPGHEVVIVAEEGLPRAEWKLGKIEKVHKDYNGKTKAADIRMPNGHVLKRPVNMLHPLEVSEEEKKARPISNKNEFVKHSVDKNLQEQGTEEVEENQIERKTTTTMNSHTLSAILVVLTATS